MQTGHEQFEFFEKQKKKFKNHYSSDCLQNIFRGIHNIIIIKISRITISHQIWLGSCIPSKQFVISSPLSFMTLPGIVYLTPNGIFISSPTYLPNHLSDATLGPENVRRFSQIPDSITQCSTNNTMGCCMYVNFNIFFLQSTMD